MQTYDLKNGKHMRARLRGEIDPFACQWDGTPVLDLDPRNPDQEKAYRQFVAHREQVQAELSQEAEARQQEDEQRAAQQQSALVNELRSALEARMDSALVDDLQRTRKALQAAHSELDKAQSDLSRLEGQAPEPRGMAIVSHRRKRSELTELVEALQGLLDTAQDDHDRAYAAHRVQWDSLKDVIYQELRQQRSALKEQYQHDDRALQQRMHAVGGL